MLPTEWRIDVLRNLGVRNEELCGPNGELSGFEVLPSWLQHFGLSWRFGIPCLLAAAFQRARNPSHSYMQEQLVDRNSKQ